MRLDMIYYNYTIEGKNHLLTNDARGDRVTSFIPTFFIPARSAIIYMLLMTFVLYMLYASKFGYKYLTAWYSNSIRFNLVAYNLVAYNENS